MHSCDWADLDKFATLRDRHIASSVLQDSATAAIISKAGAKEAALSAKHVADVSQRIVCEVAIMLLRDVGQKRTRTPCHRRLAVGRHMLGPSSAASSEWSASNGQDTFWPGSSRFGQARQCLAAAPAVKRQSYSAAEPGSGPATWGRRMSRGTPLSPLFGEGQHCKTASKGVCREIDELFDRLSLSLY